ncbi:MAG TPA: ATP-grasp domain-containing protein [Gemmatimonadaceae bacterium]|nr:ATP-grasp domain-containing protein [Gemmatimonadaceae bacterium]
MKKLRVLALLHHYLVPPEDVRGQDIANADWKTEYDVTKALRELGHDVHVLGVKDDLGAIRQANDEFKPDIAFNLMEAFHEVGTFDMNVVSYLELLRLSYTGCNPRGMLLSRDKALSKKLLAYHRIPIPQFQVIKRRRAIRLTGKLRYPAIVKSLTEESSSGIAQASVVDDDARLRERVEFIHDSLGTDAIVEQFIDGRELYVGVIGNERLEVFPVWEMQFTNMPEGVHRIATSRAKWSSKYQKKHGIDTAQAKELPRPKAEELQQLAKRAFRALEMSGYARMDFRMDGEGNCYVLEANANPHLAFGEDLAESAKRAGLEYTDLVQRILNLGIRWEPERAG